MFLLQTQTPQTVLDTKTAAKAWSSCARAMMEYDEANVKRWKEEIDTLLVFVSDLLYNFPATPLKSFISLVCFLRY